MQQTGGLVDRSVLLAARLELARHTDLNPCREIGAHGDAADCVSGATRIKRRRGQVNVIGLCGAQRADGRDVVAFQVVDGARAPWVHRLIGVPVAGLDLGHVPQGHVAYGHADLGREQPCVRDPGVFGGTTAQRDALVLGIGAVERRHPVDVGAVVVLDESLAVARHEGLFERGGGGCVAVLVTIGLGESVVGAQTAIEHLAQHVHARHRRPVEEVAAPQACARGAVMLAHICRVTADIAIRHVATLIGRVVRVALVGVEVAVVAEGGLVGVVDHAVEVDVLEIGVRLPEHGEVLGRRQHHHGLVLRGRDDVGRDHARHGQGGAHQHGHREKHDQGQFFHGSLGSGFSWAGAHSFAARPRC